MTVVHQNLLNLLGSCPNSYRMKTTKKKNQAAKYNCQAVTYTFITADILTCQIDHRWNQHHR